MTLSKFLSRMSDSCRIAKREYLAQQGIYIPPVWRAEEARNARKGL